MASLRAPRRAAALVLLAMVAVVPFASVHGPDVVGFVPAWFAAVLVCDIGTASLLAGLYRRGGGIRLAVLSTAYAWSAAVTVLMAFAVPGVVHRAPSPGSLDMLGWLWLARHVGPVALIAVALAPWRASWEAKVVSPVRVAVAATALLTAGPGLLGVLMVVDPRLLPPLSDPATLRIDRGVLLGVVVLTALALGFAVWGVAARGAGSGLETWALVAAVAWLGDAGFMALDDEMGSISYYAARLLGVAAAFVLMGAVVRELWRQYHQVAVSALTMEQRVAELIDEGRLRGHVAAVVTHDLRAPLVGLLGYLKILVEDENLDPAVIHRMHERSLMLTQRLTLLTEDLLAATTTDHADLPELTMEPRDLDVGEQLAECAGVFPTLELQLVCPRGARLYADPLRLQQILTNLVSNAHRQGADPIAVKVEPTEDEVHIKVSGAGDGVPPPTFIPRLFERYGPTVEVHGSGLGLAVVNELVRRHGGTVRYDLTAPAFIVSLPARPRPRLVGAEPECVHAGLTGS